MEKVQSTSNDSPITHIPVFGPTVTLYRSNVTKETVTMPDMEPYVIYRYTELVFQPGEYEQVRLGNLPSGVDEWTDDLRSIERSFLYDQADVKLAKASDYDTPEWKAYAEQVRAYKREVRESKNQPNYPVEVTYPTIPEQPN